MANGDKSHDTVVGSKSQVIGAVKSAQAGGAKQLEPRFGITKMPKFGITHTMRRGGGKAK